MYCDGCGFALGSGSRFCPSCGKAVAPGVWASPVAPPSSSEGRVHRHLNTLAWFWLANGILRLITVAWVYAVGSTLMPWVLHSFVYGFVPFGPGWMIDSFARFGLFSAMFLLAFFGGAHLLLAWGLFERQAWARPLGLVIGFLALIRFPLGTALGIYTIWVLLPESSSREYQAIARA